MELIYKQAAIDSILGQPPEPHYPSWYAEQIKQLPPAQPHTYRGVTLNDVMMYFDSLEGNEDAWTEFCSCFECRGWGLYHIRSATDKNVGNNEDCINRKQALAILYDFAGCIVDTPNGDYHKAYKKYHDMMEQLPPAQPEIVRCKDCEHYKYGICMKICANKSPIGFCDWGRERRTDG